MDASSWLDEVARALVAARIPWAYRQRLLEELRDHINDSYCAERSHAMSTEAIQDNQLEARLGAPSEIVEAAERQVAEGYFARRHPVITFLVAPLPAWLLLLTGYVLLLIGVCHLGESMKDSSWAVALAGILFHGIAYVPAVTLTLLIGWLAIRSSTRLAWWITGSALVGLVSGLVAVTFRLPTAPGTGTLQVGLGFPPPLAHWPQVVVPLAITAVMIMLAARKRELANTAQASTPTSLLVR